MNNFPIKTVCEKYLHLAIVEIKASDKSIYYSPQVDLMMRLKKIISKINGSNKVIHPEPTNNITYTVTPEHAELFAKYERTRKQKFNHDEYILDDKDETDESKSSGGRTNVFSNKPK